MDSGIELEGFEEFLTAIKAMGEESNPVMKEALQEVGKEFVKDLKPRLDELQKNPHRLPGPSDSWRDSTRLADAISASRALGDDGNYYVLGGLSKREMKSHWYARLLEYGTYKMTAKAPFGRTIIVNFKKYEEMLASKLKEGLNL